MIGGKYRVVRLLGEGGIGVVLEAEHVALGQTVAIKFLRPEVSDPEMAARFLREARASVRLSGEHVAKVSDVGEEDGSPYMVMEYLRGQDLDQVLDARGKLPIEEVVGYILQALVGVAEAHARGIVHRDLKPANLFLTKSADGSALVKVLDFGISKVDGLDDGASTSTAVVMGSPFYMSPEQMLSTKDVDVRTDIWAIGIILFQLVSGRLPFREDSIPALTLKLHTEQAPNLRRHVPNAPVLLDRIIARCLLKDRRARYPTVGALARALGPLASPGDMRLADTVVRLVGEGEAPVAAAPATPAKPVPLAAVALGAAALLAATLGVTYVIARRPAGDVIPSAVPAAERTAGSVEAATSAVAVAAPVPSSTGPVQPPPSALPSASVAPSGSTGDGRKPPPHPTGVKKPPVEVDPFGTSRR